MERALALARSAQGWTSPNPPVGAVLVRDGGIVGEGCTQQAGQAHAEIVALNEAGEAATGATLYVTLEPCSHWGRTPPCTDALIAAGVSCVHIALLDPNPRVNGRGIHRLEQHGIHVTTGECATEAAELVEAHAKYITECLPFVTLLLSPPEEVAARLHAVTDAVLTDESESLPARTRPATAGPSGPIRPPLRVLVGDPAEGVPPGDDRTLVATTYLEAAQHQTRNDGRQLLAVPSMSETIDYAALLAELGRHEITSCLVSGSPALANTFLTRSLVDKIVAGKGASLPTGFTLWREVGGPSPHLILYPVGRAT
jgi:diaminohydroxyphosphoribosylaminopyrimidine deaminase/5-amino-6-(5-phosphoribosylamino)uracil reductase